MPSPLAHTLTAYIVYKKTNCFKNQFNDVKNSYLFIWSVFFSMLPDIDVLPGIIFNDMYNYHNQMMNSLFMCIVLSFITGIVAKFILKKSFSFWSLYCAICYGLHIIMDYFTFGRGTKILWPLSQKRYSPPFNIFYGFRWSEGLISNEHVYTFFSELLTMTVIILMFSFIKSKKNLCGK